MRYAAHFSARLLVACVLLALVAAPASAKRPPSFALKKLTLGTGGPEDYLFTAGNQVTAQASIDPTALSYRFQVFDAGGAVRTTTPCMLPTKRTVTGSYTIQSGDPLSNGTAWAFELQQFSNATCTGTVTKAHLNFDVAKATAFAPGAPPSVQRTTFPAAGSAYVRAAGIGVVKSTATNTAQSLWTTTWVLPSGATACADTGVNRPGSSAVGNFPMSTLGAGQSFLEYAPSSYGNEPFNFPASYTSACPAMALANQGQWQLKLQKDATHFVTLPAFSVDATAPETTLTSAPGGTQNNTTAAFQFTSSDAGATFACDLDGTGFSTCTSGKSYSSLSQGSHTFSVRAIDAAGNIDATPATRAWTVDTVGPLVTLSVPGASAQLNDSTPTLSGTAGNAGGDQPTVTVEIYSGAIPFLAAPVQSFNVTRSGAAWSVPQSAWDASGTPLPDGTYVAVAKQLDSALPANNTGFSDFHEFFVDTQPPSVSVLHPAGGATTATNSPVIDGTAGSAATDTSSVTVEIFSGTSASGSPARSFSAPASGGTWALDPASWDAGTASHAPLTEGTWTVRASQSDAAGNSGTSFTRTFVVDMTAPNTTITSGPGSTTADTAAAFDFTSSEPGSSFQCALDGGSFTACTSPKSYAGLGAGAHSVQIQAVDAAGNTDPTPATWSWTIDAAVPLITITSPVDGLVTSNGSPIVQGTAGTAAGDATSVTVRVYSAAAPATAIRTLPTTRDAAGAWSTPITPALPDGTYVYHAEQSDNAAHTGFSATRTITVDTTAPTTTITQAPASPTASTQATLRFAASKAGSTFECRLDGVAYGACSSPKTYTGLAEGPHTFDVRATDTAGNTDTTGATATWTVNSAVPHVTLTSPADGITTGDSTPSFGGVAGTNTAGGDATTITLDIYRLVAGSAPQLAQQRTNVTVDSGTGAWSATASPALDDGTYVAHAEQLGAAGTGFSADRTFTIDATPPETSVAGGPPGLTRATTASFNLSSNEPSSTFQCNLDGAGWSACTSPASYSSLADGQHTLLVRATDAAGNTDPTPAQRLWTVDSTAPAPALTAPAQNAVLNTANPAFSGTSTDPSTGTIVEIYAASDTGTPVDTIPASAPGATWTVTEDNGLDDGAYLAYAEQADAAGNTAYSEPLAFIIDTTAPSVSLNALASPSGAHPAFHGSAGTAPRDAATVTVKVYLGATPTGSAVRTLNVSRSGSSWSASPTTPLASGTYTARAEQADSAGNTGLSDPRTFVVDATAPTTTIASGPSGTTTARTAAFAFSASDGGATFACKLDGAAFTACTSPKSYSGLAVGSHTFQVRATDGLGNVEPTPASRSWTVAAAPSGSSTPSGSTPSGGGSTPPPSGGTPITPPACVPGATSGTGCQQTATPITLKLAAAKKQRLSKRVLVVTVSCSAICNAKVSALTKLTKRNTKLGSAKGKAIAGKKLKLKIKLSKKLIAKLKRALAAHKKGLTIQLTATATPAGAGAAAAKPVKLKIRLLP